MAEWLYDYLKDGLPVLAVHVYNDCAKAFEHIRPNPLGVKNEKGYWAKGYMLTRSADIDLPELAYPRSGKAVNKFLDPTQANRSSWQLVDAKLSNQTAAPY